MPGKGPPPPPPPPGARGAGAGLGVRRAPEVVAMYQELRKALIGEKGGGKGGQKSGKGGARGSAEAGDFRAEIEGKSAYITAVKRDVEDYADFIRQLAGEVRRLRASSMPDLCTFVDVLDEALDVLFDADITADGKTADRGGDVAGAGSTSRSAIPWLAISLPSTSMRCRRRSRLATCSPSTKNVAAASCVRSTSRICGV